MEIRRAVDKDADKVIELLSQVLEVHAALRPDLFISGTTKYTKEELYEMFKDDTKPVFVGVDENDVAMGYAFCVINEPVESNNVVPHRSIYVDDICVDEKARGQHVASHLFEYVKSYAASIGCYSIELNVWDGNEPARALYENMGMGIKKTCMEYIL